MFYFFWGVLVLDRSWEASRNSSTITPGDGSDQGVDEDFKTSKKHKKRKKKGKKYKHGNSDGDNKG